MSTKAELIPVIHRINHEKALTHSVMRQGNFYLFNPVRI